MYTGAEEKKKWKFAHSNAEQRAEKEIKADKGDKLLC